MGAGVLWRYPSHSCITVTVATELITYIHVIWSLRLYRNQPLGLPSQVHWLIKFNIFYIAHCSLHIPYENVVGYVRVGGRDQLPGGVCAVGDHLQQNTEENKEDEDEVW